MKVSHRNRFGGMEKEKNEFAFGKFEVEVPWYTEMKTSVDEVPYMKPWIRKEPKMVTISPLETIRVLNSIALCIK